MHSLLIVHLLLIVHSLLTVVAFVNNIVQIYIVPAVSFNKRSFYECQEKRAHITLLGTLDTLLFPTPGRRRKGKERGTRMKNDRPFFGILESSKLRFTSCVARCAGRAAGFQSFGVRVYTALGLLVS